MKPFLALWILFLVTLFFNPTSTTPTINAIFSFGDSLYDTGNYLIATNDTTFIKNPPYGQTYFGHPTGRNTDGRLIIDFIAEAFGLPLQPPYLAKNHSFIKGASFAVTWATALDATFFQQEGFQPGTPYSLNIQVEWFEQLLPSLCNTTADCEDYFKKALFMVGEIGSNDYNILGSFNPGSFVKASGYVAAVVQAIKNATETLIKLGAVNLVVPGNPPAGCFPGIIAVNGVVATERDFDDKLGCLKGPNDLVTVHNEQLREAVKELSAAYPNVWITYADLFKPLVNFINAPSKHGFSYDPLKACCGGGGPQNINMQALCGMPGSTVCADPSAAIYWDGWRATEAAHRKIALGWLNGPYADRPIMSLSTK